MAEKKKKVLPEFFVGEGYIEQELNNQNDPWIGIFAQMQNNMIEQDYVTAIETHKLGDKTVPCMVIMFEGGIKGIIPSYESGIPGTSLEEMLKAALAEAPQEELPAPIQEEKPKKGRKSKKDQETEPVIEETTSESLTDAEKVKIISNNKILKVMRSLIGQQVVFKVMHIDVPSNLCILSRKNALEQMQAVTWKDLKEGDIRTAVIRNVTPFSVRLSVGGIETVMPISEVGSRVNSRNAMEELKPGMTIEVKIIKADKDKNKLQVSARALSATEDYWKAVTNTFKIQGEYKGTVQAIKQFGIFVSLGKDVFVLVPHPRYEDDRKNLKKGQQVLVRITKIDTEKQRINARLSKILR